MWPGLQLSLAHARALALRWLAQPIMYLAGIALLITSYLNELNQRAIRAYHGEGGNRAMIFEPAVVSLTVVLVVYAHLPEDRLPVEEVVRTLRQRRDAQGPSFTYEVLVAAPDPGRRSQSSATRASAAQATCAPFEPYGVRVLPCDAGDASLGSLVKAAVMAARGERILVAAGPRDVVLAATSREMFSALDKYLGQVLARTAPQLAGRKEEGVLLAQPPSTPESIADWGDADVYGVAFAVQGQGGTGAEGTGMSGAGVSPREAGPGMGRGAGALLGTSLEWPGSWRDLWRRVQHGAIGAPCVAGLFTRPAAATVFSNVRLAGEAVQLELPFLLDRLRVPTAVVPLPTTTGAQAGVGSGEGRHEGQFAEGVSYGPVRALGAALEAGMMAVGYGVLGMWVPMPLPELHARANPNGTRAKG